MHSMARFFVLVALTTLATPLFPAAAADTSWYVGRVSVLFSIEDEDRDYVWENACYFAGEAIRRAAAHGRHYDRSVESVAGEIRAHISQSDWWIDNYEMGLDYRTSNAGRYEWYYHRTSDYPCYENQRYWA